MIVTNKNGTEINFEHALREMDAEVKDSLKGENFTSEQDYFTAYEKKHQNLLGYEWDLSR